MPPWRSVRAPEEDQQGTPPEERIVLEDDAERLAERVTRLSRKVTVSPPAG